MKLGFIGLGRMGVAMGSLLHDRFLRLLAQGGEHLDWAALGGLASQDAGNDALTACLA
jgi:6-phosphogluconate dehydrogenase (decarboxylating)